MNTKLMTLMKQCAMACVVVLAFACKHSFEPPALTAESRPLVVEGFINVGTQVATTMTLSRVQDVGKSDSLLAEFGATVSLEGAGGDKHPMVSEGNGKYSTDTLNLDPAQQYRLNIQTTDGHTYASDFLEVKQTQPIDSLQWEQDGDVTVYVNTHDPANNSRYYRWDYVETWNYPTNIASPWDVSNRLIFYKATPDLQTDSCWRTAYSTEIVLGTSIALADDVIAHQLVATIPINSEKISQRYSILVRQYVLTPDAYQFHLTLQKNTQQTGSLFDPQPSQLPTNVHCTSNPDETVIGYISASSVQEKRIFIRSTEVKNWNYPGQTGDCSVVFAAVNPVDFRIFEYPDTSYVPYYFITGGPVALVRRPCTDCRSWGGTNIKPSYW